MSANPNNCEKCDHWKLHSEEGHCYMFREEPMEICRQHTSRDILKQFFRDPKPHLIKDIPPEFKEKEDESN
jgi:hypothetical protein